MTSSSETGPARAAAGRLRAQADTLASNLTNAYFRRHPEALERWGEQGRQRTLEDFRYHVEFAAAATEVGSPPSFAEFVRWTVRVLAARSVGPEVVLESLEMLEEAAGRVLASEHLPPLAAVLAAGRAAAASPPANESNDAAAGGEALSAYVQALLAGRRDAALRVALEELERGRSVVDVYADLLQPAQVEIGRLWESNRITVAREHMATAITQFVMAQLYPRLERGAERRGRAVITGVEGELHQVGAHMVADVLEADGWDVRFLGCGAPHRGVLDAVAEHDAEAVGISAALLANLPRVRELTVAIHELQPERRPRVIVGGAALRHAPELWRELGADGFAAGLRDAVPAFRTVTG